jgi:hypothetical protein
MWFEEACDSNSLKCRKVIFCACFFSSPHHSAPQQLICVVRLTCGLRRGQGSGGPVCGGCSDRYTFNLAKAQCVACGSSSNNGAIAVGVLFCILPILAFIYLRVLGHDVPNWVWDTPPVSFIKFVDAGMLKVAWSTYQIVSTV